MNRVLFALVADWLNSCYYRPQTKSAKVMVLHMSVSYSVQWGEGLVSQHALQVVSQHALQVSSGAGVVSQHALQVSRPTPRGKLRGLAWGGSPGPPPGRKLRGLAWLGSTGPHPGGSWGVWPGGCLQAHTWGASPGTHPGGSPDPHLGGLQADTPSWRLLLQAVRILLECILVLNMIFEFDLATNVSKFSVCSVAVFSQLDHFEKLERRLTVA